MKYSHQGKKYNGTVENSLTIKQTQIHFTYLGVLME